MALPRARRNPTAEQHIAPQAAVSEDTQAEIPSSLKDQQLEDGKTKDTSEICRQFKRTLCHKDITVEFVGVWSAPLYI